MLLGFLSLLLTVGQGLISRICISEKVASTWHPCSHENTDTTEESEQGTNSRRLLAAFHGSNEVTSRRVLAGGGSDKCGEVGRILLFFSVFKLCNFHHILLQKFSLL